MAFQPSVEVDQLIAPVISEYFSQQGFRLCFVTQPGQKARVIANGVFVLAHEPRQLVPQASQGFERCVGIALELPFTVSRRSLDRKSTRLNSSHVKISYAVFCLK